MHSPLIEDFSDAAAFVQEDTSYVEQNASEDEVERKIAEEHAKFKEALARRQEEVRANRPWSAPPVDSPRPEQQKERLRERQARDSTGDAVDLDAPRAEYEPPVRAYLLPAQTSGNNLSYLSRPQSAEHRTAVATRVVNGHSRVSLSGIEEEAGEGTACDSRQASEMGRLGGTSGEGLSTSGGSPDDIPGRDQFTLAKDDTLLEDVEGEMPVREGTIPEEDEEEEEEEEEERAWDGGGGDGDSSTQRQQEGEEDQGQQHEPYDDPRVPEPSAEEVAEDEGSGGGALGGFTSGDIGEGSSHFGKASQAAEASGMEDGAGDAEVVDDGVLLASAEGLESSSLGVENYYGYGQQKSPRTALSYGADSTQLYGSDARRDQGEEDPGQEGEEEQAEQQAGEMVQARQHVGGDALSTARGAPSVVASSTGTHSMAMRGFVEPLPYDASYGASSVGQRSPTVIMGDMADSRSDEDEEEDYGEDTFEDDEELEEYEDAEVGNMPSTEPPLLGSGEGSMLRPSPSVSKGLISTSMRSRSGSTVMAPPSREASKTFSIGVLPPPQPMASASTASLSQPIFPVAVRANFTEAEDEDSPEVLPSYPTVPSVSASSLPPISKTNLNNTGSGATATETLSAIEQQLSGRSHLGPSHSQRSLSSNGSVIPGPSALAPPPATAAALSELQPSQQFALQLLKHDIEVLPQHHRAAAEAAVARRKSSATRPPSAGLATFGYLGYHMISEDLTAPSGPGFRSTSPGRGISPGRGDSGLIGNSSLKAVQSTGPLDTVISARSAARPTSAPHMRPSGGIVADAATGGDGSGRGTFTGDDGAVGVATNAGGTAEGAVAPGAGFVGLAREMRAGRLLPPVVPPTAPRMGRSTSGSGNRGAGGDDAALAGENSVSVMGEHDLNLAVTQSRIKFDVWLDALSNGSPPVSNPTAGAAGTASNLSSSGGEPERAPHNGAAGRRAPRPMTAPASGRRRPTSARPGGGMGSYMIPQAAISIPKPLIRPMSAQPHHLRPTSASLSRGGGGSGPTAGAVGAIGHFDTSIDAPIPMTVQPPDTSAAGGTAAVEVGGVTVSVYVADTLKRIVEANRWLQQLGLTTKRYRLKDRFSNMTIQMVEELPPLPSERGGGGLSDSSTVAIIKELTLKQFLSGHAKLKQQAKKFRNATAAAAAAVQQLQSSVVPVGANPVGPGGVSGGYGITDYTSGRNGRPISASFGNGGNIAGPAGGNTGRVRPASAMQYSSARMTAGSSGGVDMPLFGPSSGAVAQAGIQTGRPVRPSSANPAYGRTPMVIPYYTGSSPPGVHSSPFMQSAYAAHAATGAVGTAALTKSPGGGGSNGGLPQPRAAWAAGGGLSGGAVSSAYPSFQGAPATGGRVSGGGASNSLPYMHRSISASAGAQAAPGLDVDNLHPHLEEDNESERAMVIEPDERGDVSRAVRQQLGSASDYCQARRQEIARLRTLPLA